MDRSCVGEEDRKKERDLRRKYQALIDETKHNTPDDNSLSEKIHQANSLFKDVKGCGEAVFDSTLVTLQSSIVRYRTQKMHTNLTAFIPEDYLNKMAAHIKKTNLGAPNKVELLSVLNFCSKESKQKINIAPSFTFLYGSFEQGEVEVKKRTRRSRTKDVTTNAVQKPLVVSSEELDKHGYQASQEAERILSTLITFCNKTGNPICYFEFVVNPYSFAETIENMFYVSVLIKEGVVTIYPDEKGLPVIGTVSDEAMQAKDQKPCNQSILSISKQDWRDIVKAYKIEKPFLVRKKVKKETLAA